VGVSGGAAGGGQSVVGVAANDRVQVETALPGVVVQEPSPDQVPEVGIERGSAARRLRQRLECVVLHRAAKAGDAAEQGLARQSQAVVGSIQHVMLALDQVAAHV